MAFDVVVEKLLGFQATNLSIKKEITLTFADTAIMFKKMRYLIFSPLILHQSIKFDSSPFFHLDGDDDAGAGDDDGDGGDDDGGGRIRTICSSAGACDDDENGDGGEGWSGSRVRASSRRSVDLLLLHLRVRASSRLSADFDKTAKSDAPEANSALVNLH